MVSRYRRFLIFLPIIGVLSAVFLSSCGTTVAVSETPSSAPDVLPGVSEIASSASEAEPTVLETAVTALPAKPVAPVQVELVPQTTPPLGGTMQLLLIVTAQIDLSDAEVSLHVPVGVTVLSGALTQRARLTRDTPQHFAFDLQLAQSGTHMIAGSVSATPADQGRIGARDVLFLDVSTTMTTVYRDPPPPTPGDQQTEPAP